MVPECGESHLSQTLVHLLLVQNGAAPIPVRHRPASFCTMCASSPSPTSTGRRYWTGMGAAPSPTRVLVGVPAAPSPTHIVQFLNRRRSINGSGGVPHRHRGSKFRPEGRPNRDRMHVSGCWRRRTILSPSSNVYLSSTLGHGR
jgi:hypothetical protein